MASFSATDAALEGFRITRERPRALLAWTLFSFLVSVAGVLITVNMPAEARAALESLQSEQTPDPNALGQMLAVLSPLLVFGLTVQCVMAAAVYRIILRPADRKHNYLALGMDEVRLMALTLIYIVLVVGLLAIGQIGISIIAAALMFALGEGVLPVVALVDVVAVICVGTYLGVRMSLAPVITFDSRRLAILDSWEMTRGHFWRLLGAYILALCCIVVVAILVMMLFYMLAMIVMLAIGGGPEDLRALLQPDETTLRSYLNPFMIAYMVVGSLFTAIYYAVIASPGALAYRQLTAAELEV
jgi:hypothetical protein